MSERGNALWRSRREKDELAGWLLRNLVGVRRATNTARRLFDGPEEEWGSRTRLALARTAGRRCGEIFSVCLAEEVAPLLAKLPRD